MTLATQNEEEAALLRPRQKGEDSVEMSSTRKHIIVCALVFVLNSLVAIGQTNNVHLVSVAVFLPACDTSIVATLTTVIGDEFKSTQQGSWLATSYLMSLALCSPVYGRLAGYAFLRGWPEDGSDLLLIVFLVVVPPSCLRSVSLLLVLLAVVFLAPSLNSSCEGPSE